MCGCEIFGPEGGGANAPRWSDKFSKQKVKQIVLQYALSAQNRIRSLDQKGAPQMPPIGPERKLLLSVSSRQECSERILHEKCET